MPTAAGSPPGLPADQPSALARWPEIAARLGGRRLALFLDYDGTLSPIVQRPELAVLPEATPAGIPRLGGRARVAVLAGRAGGDAAGLRALPQLYYAGSPGFDIPGPPPSPGEPPLRHEVGAGVPERVDRLAERLRRDLAGIDGVLVEPKRFAGAVHHRLADDPALPRTRAAGRRPAPAPAPVA